MDKKNFNRILEELRACNNAGERAHVLQRGIHGEPKDVYSTILVNAVGREVYEYIRDNSN